MRRCFWESRFSLKPKTLNRKVVFEDFGAGVLEPGGSLGLRVAQRDRAEWFRAWGLGFRDT